MHRDPVSIHSTFDRLPPRPSRRRPQRTSEEGWHAQENALRLRGCDGAVRAIRMLLLLGKALRAAGLRSACLLPTVRSRLSDRLRSRGLCPAGELDRSRAARPWLLPVEIN